MRKVHTLTAVVVASLAGAVAVGQFYDGPFGPPPRYGFPGEGMPVRTSQFSGEVLVVPHKASDGRRQVSALLRPDVRRLGDRQYLVGQDAMADQAGDAADAGRGVTLWIPLERTAELHEYKSIEDARQVWDLGRQPDATATEEVVVPERP